ncbi:hypothetical protein JHD50_10585 [Sulfurimonas sp. MAG313]|nr:hypothetical protein [Sulfurimonas sp. MAG313]MDF1881738.1 hypothetical protein [Sulfurimonas sp. MAG313]
MIIRPAIITIEVLIALIIMFSAVVLTTSSLRTMNLFKLKKEKYEINYSTVLSLKALFENRRFNPLGGEFSGEINGLKYEMKYTLSENKKTYVVGETAALEGNYGPYYIYLYTCVLQLIKNNSFSESTFDVLKYTKVPVHE